MSKYNYSILKLAMILAFLTSCKKDPELNKNINIIDISKTSNKKQKINLSTIASKIEYIQLQGDSTSYLGQIYSPKRNIKFFGDKILVSDAYDKLLLFNTRGKFLNKIGNVGRGPQEYVKPTGFTIIKNNKEALAAVFSAGKQKVLLYTLGGDYVKELPIDFWPFSLTSINENLVFVNTIGKRKQSGYHTLSVVSSNNGDLKKRLLYKANEKKIEKNKKFGLSAMYNSYTLNNTLSYWEKDYDTIWRITNELKAIPKYVIDIGGNKMPFEEQTPTNIVDVNKRKKYNAIIEVQETSRFFFITSSFKGRRHRLYYDKLFKESTSIEFKKEKKYRNNFYFETQNEQLQLDKELKLISIKGDTILAKDVFDTAKLVLRYAESNCRMCVDAEHDILIQNANNIKDNVVILSTYSRLRGVFMDFKKLKGKGLENISIYLIPDSLELPLEQQNMPYYFVVQKDLTTSSFFIPAKEDPKLSTHYVESILKNLNREK